ncbi:hypothetical protein BCR32DRAFT_290678 [Anaeromyces robustus]|uniref:SH3 domain-containing protein n=1 Tax=Anaeromyces robustus TaxID=1754192 RepID=A0A1Y1XI95_9FUNG|nr:hypothetical protein BCR32DRAFT_290678 [Anaeromyces robustus]|eukprot:ORX85480.1 hypothetical protein BCR32DRAFT_290678 [Anaeromyces robustus]
MSNTSKNTIFPTINKNHIKDTFGLYNQLVKNAAKYQSAMINLATSINELSVSYDAFMSYPPMRAIIESSGQQTEIHNSLKIYRILYESFKKMSEFLNRDFALPLNDDFKSMQVKFSDKKIEKTLKMEEKQRTKSMLPGCTPEPSNIQRGLFQQYISAIKFVSRKTKKLQNYEIHVFQRMVQGIVSYEDQNVYNSFILNQSMSQDQMEEPTPRLNYQSYNKKSIMDVSQIDNGILDESILKGINHDKNPLTNSFIKEEVKKNERNGDGKYFSYNNHSPVSSNNNILRDSIFGKDVLDNELDANVNSNTNKSGSTDYFKHDYHHQRYTSTPNIYEMKYIANKHEDKTSIVPPSSSSKESHQRGRSKSLGHSQNSSDNYKQNHYSMPAFNNKNTTNNYRFSTPANVNVDEKRNMSDIPYMALGNKRSNTINSQSSQGSASGNSVSGKSNLSQVHNIDDGSSYKSKSDVNEEVENEEANTTITENNIKRESKLLNKKSSFKKNLSEMKHKLHKRRSQSSSPATKPISILKKRSATFSLGSSHKDKDKDKEKEKEKSESGSMTIGKNDDLSKLQNMINDDEDNDDDEFIVISKKKMDSLIRTGKVHSLDDILKKRSSDTSSLNSNSNKEESKKEMVSSPVEIKKEDEEKVSNSNIPTGFVEETPNLAEEATPKLSENVSKPLSRHSRTGSYGGISQSHIRGISSNLASKNFSSSIVPNGYATPMLGHQELTLPHSKLSQTSIPMEYATPMLSRFNNNNYSPMLANDVPHVKDDITPPTAGKKNMTKSAASLQNLLNNWPNVEALTQSVPKPKAPVFTERKNSLPNYRKENTPKITIEPNDKQGPNDQKKKGVNFNNDNNKEYLIPPNSAASTNINDENSYFDDIINVTYATDNEESSMMINDPTRLIFSKFNTSVSNISGITEGDESTLQTPTPTTTTFNNININLNNNNNNNNLTVPSKNKLSNLRHIITQEVLNDELPPTPVSPTNDTKNPLVNSRLNISNNIEDNEVGEKIGEKEPEPDNPTRGESLHFNPRLADLKIKKNDEELEEEVIEDKDGLLTPIERIDDNETTDSEDDIKLADLPRFNKKILNLRLNNTPKNVENELVSPCPTTFMLDKIKEIEDKNKNKDNDEEENQLDYNSEEDLDILRFISYRKAPEALEKHLKENEYEEEIEHQQEQEPGQSQSQSQDQGQGQEHEYQYEQNKNEQEYNQNVEKEQIPIQEKDPFDYTEEGEANTTIDAITAREEIDIPKKMDRKDSMKSVISNISSKFSQKLNSMFYSNEGNSNNESDASSINKENNNKKKEVENVTEDETHVPHDHDETEFSQMTEMTADETTIDESAIKQDIEEQKKELAQNKDVFTLARKLSSDFIKGGGDLIRRSSKESLKSLSRKFSMHSNDAQSENVNNNENVNVNVNNHENEIDDENENENDEDIIKTTEKPEKMEAMMQKSNSVKIEFPRRHSSASLRNYHRNEDKDDDEHSVKTVTSANLPRKDSLIRATSVKKQSSIRSIVTNGSNLTSTPIMNPDENMENINNIEEDSIIDETPKIDDFPEKPQRIIPPQRPGTPNAPNTPVFPNIKLCNILMNNEESSYLNLNNQEGNNDVIVISNPLLEVTNNKNLVDYKNDLPDERREFRISRNEAYMTFDLCPKAVDIESVMGSVVDPDEDSLRMEMLNNESSLSFRSINPSGVYEENNSVIITAPKYKNKGKKPELEIDTHKGNTSQVVAIIPSPIPQKDNNFAQRFNNLNAASLVQETREQKINNSNNYGMKKYVALYPYNARDGRELSFQRADIINVRREQGEWVYGYKENLQGIEEEVKYGWVPKSYLKIITIF